MNLDEKISKNMREIIAVWHQRMDDNEETNTFVDSAIGYFLIQILLMLKRIVQSEQFTLKEIEFNVFRRHDLTAVMYELQILRQTIGSVIEKSSSLTTAERLKLQSSYDFLCRQVIAYYMDTQRVLSRQFLPESIQVQKIFSTYRNDFQKLFESSLGGVVLSDNDLTISALNPYVMNLLGYSADDESILKKTLADLTPVGFRHVDEEAINELKSGVTRHTFERPLTRSNGDIIWVIMGYEHSDSDESSLICFMIDCTERKKLETNLAESLKKVEDFSLNLRGQYRSLESSHQHLIEEHDEVVHQREVLKRRNLELDEFAATVAHDLKSPLASIIQCSSMITNKIVEHGTPVFDETIGYIDSSSKRMLHLVNGLLEYARADHDLEEFSMIDLNRALGISVENLKNQLQTCQLEISLLPTIVASETQMIQLFQNLLGNAAKFGGESNTVRIEYILEGNSHLFSVSDEGPGIEKTLIKNLFQPFKRGADTSKSGSGLGLAICKRIVNRHGGEIWAENNVLSGAIITFSIPAKT